MVLKERKLWKQEPVAQIRDFVAQEYSRIIENPCPVDRLKIFSDRTRRSSCGECVICREGILQFNVLAEAITQGGGRDGDPMVLREIAEDMCIGSACDYGKEVGKIVKALLDEETEQFERHIKRKRCDALVCRKFIYFSVAPEKCIGCGRCAGVCAAGAVSGGDGLIHVINQTACNRCGDCAAACGSDAIQKTGSLPLNLPEEPLPVGSVSAEGAQGGLMSQKRRRRSE